MAVEQGYECKECGSPVVLVDGQIVRSCKHTGTVIAVMEAHVTASGGVTNAPQRAERPNGL